MFKRKKAQSTLEYAVIIAVVAAAVLAMQIYMRRGIQGKLKESADDIGEQYSTKANITTTSVSNVTGLRKTQDRITYKDLTGLGNQTSISKTLTGTNQQITTTTNTTGQMPNLGNETLWAQ